MTIYNIAKYRSASVGRNNWSVSLGKTRNTLGSSTRIYKYWSRNSLTPLYYMFQFTPPIPVSPIPVPPIPVSPIPVSPIPVPRKFLGGFLSYSFIYVGTSLTESLVLENIPINTLNGVFEITPNITITANNVYVEIETKLYEDTSYESNLGFTFNKNNLLVNFYNNLATNLTMISANNCPFSGTGSQFSGLYIINISSDFKPYFLPNASLSNCFKNCPSFNSDISGWDVSNVTTMESMFKNCSFFNSDISGWDTSNVTTMNSMFEATDSFNKNISRWDVSNVTSLNNMFYEAAEFNNGESYGGGTSPLNWKFNITPTHVNWRRFSGLTINNAKTEPQLSLF